MGDTLFDEPSAFDRDALAGRLRRLSAEGIYIGGSSWKYEGWIGQVYSRANYLSRGRFSRPLFEATCLQEYAQTFPTVCGDFAFYQFPTPGVLGQAVLAGARRVSNSPSKCRNRSPAKCFRRTRATARRPARRTMRF